MALTFPAKTDNRVWDHQARVSLGNRIQIERVMAFDSNYQTGGLDFPFRSLILRQVDHLDIDPVGSYLFQYDYINNKVKVFVESGGGITINPASAGTPTGVVSQPVFTGDPIGHDHDILGTYFFNFGPSPVVANFGTISEYPALITMVDVTAGGSIGPKLICSPQNAPQPGWVQVVDNTVGNVMEFYFNPADAVTEFYCSFVNYAGLTQFINQNITGAVSQPIFNGDPLTTHTHAASGGGSFNEVAPGTDLSFLNAVKFRCYGIG